MYSNLGASVSLVDKYFELRKNNRQNPFINFFRDFTSENGEDGVIEEILKRLNVLDSRTEKWCVEFGAWDGIFASNTFNLVKNYDFNSVYIEGDFDRFQDLKNNAKTYPKINPINAMVDTFENSDNRLDKILESTQIPSDFEILSIDVDSNDLEIWESLQNYAPKIVVIEINSSIPPGIIWRDSPNTPGNTFTATLNVARRKKYSLLCHTGNLIFIQDKFLSKINIPQRFIDDPDTLFLYGSKWTSNNPFMNNQNTANFLKKVRSYLNFKRWLS